jgi:hypothetical protein
MGKAWRVGLAEKKTGDEQPVKIEFQAFDGEADELF